MSFSKISLPRRQPAERNLHRSFAAWREAASRQVLADRNISHAAKSAYHFVLWHMNRRSGGWALKMETIAAGTGMSARSARRAVAELEAHGYLERERRRGRSNFYVPLGGGDNFSTADRFVRGGGQIRPGSNGTGRTNLSAITQTPESNPGRRGFAPTSEGSEATEGQTLRPRKLTGELEASLQRAAAAGGLWPRAKLN